MNIQTDINVSIEERADKADMSHQVWALFSNGTANVVSLVPTATDESNEIVLEPVGLSDRELMDSAEKSMRGAFYALKQIKPLKQRSYGFAYGFKGKGQFVKSSAALAMAMALVHRLEDLPFSVAATGEINDHSPQTTIEPVDALNEKIQIGLQKLKTGDILLYPAANTDIDPELNKIAFEKEIMLKAVNTIEDAVQTLMACQTLQSRSDRNEFFSIEPEPPPDARKIFISIYSKWLAGLFVIIFIVLLFEIHFYPHHLQHLKDKFISTNSVSPITIKIAIQGNDTEVNQLITRTIFEPLRIKNRDIRYVIEENKTGGNDETGSAGAGTKSTATISGETILKESVKYVKNEKEKMDGSYTVSSKISLIIRDLTIQLHNSENKAIWLGNFSLTSEMDFETLDVFDKTLADLKESLLKSCCMLMESHIENKYPGKMLSLKKDLGFGNK